MKDWQLIAVRQRAECPFLFAQESLHPNEYCIGASLIIQNCPPYQRQALSIIVVVIVVVVVVVVVVV